MQARRTPATATRIPARKRSRKNGARIRLLAAGALFVASACAAPMLATETGPAAQSPAPMSCGIATEIRGGMTIFRPWVWLDLPRPMSFRFTVQGYGTAINQGGSLYPAAPGQSILGEAMVTGPAANYDARLTIDTGGVTYTCPVAGQDL